MYVLYVNVKQYLKTTNLFISTQQVYKSHSGGSEGKGKDELAHINQKINVMKGLFQTKFDNTLDEMNLKRQIYHKGTLVGSDIAKILQPIHIKQIVDNFKPIDIKLKYGEKRVFSDL